MSEHEVLQRFYEEPLPPAGVDVQRAIRDGRRRNRTRRGLAALAVVALAGAAVAVVPLWHQLSRPDGAASAEEQLHQQARDDLDRYELAFASGGSDGFAPVGELTGQVGDWEPANGDNKQALLAGLLVAAVALPAAPQPTGIVAWDDGHTKTVPVVAADAALQQLKAAIDNTCPDCRPLQITAAVMTTVRIDTTRGTATVPAWEYTLQGTAVRVTQVAVARSATFTVTPPPWDPNHAPGGISIRSATVTAAGTELTVNFIGATTATDDPCGAHYDGEVMVSAHAAVVIVYEHPNSTASIFCDLVGHNRTVTIQLPQPLGQRAVLEVVQGMPVPLTVD